MAVASWMLRNRSLRHGRGIRGRYENKEDQVQLDYSNEPCKLMHEVLRNVCLKHGISNIKKLNYLTAFVQLLTKYIDWDVAETFGFTLHEILCCLRIALIQDTVQLRAAGLRAVRYILRTAEDITCLNSLHYPYLISRSLDLILKTDNERILMSERIQALRLMRHILAVSPKHFTSILVRPLVSVALRPLEESDRLLRACLGVLCELCVLNSPLFIECDGVSALVRNITLVPSNHMSEAISGSLLYLLNDSSTRQKAKIDLHYLASFYTSINTSTKISLREEERKLLWTNITLMSLLRSWCGLLHFCYPGNSENPGGLQSVLCTLYLSHYNTRKAVVDMLYDLIGAEIPEWTDNSAVALDSINPSKYRDIYHLSEGFVVEEGRRVLPPITKCRMNLVESHISLILYCLLEYSFPDILVEVIVDSDEFLSIRATVLLGQFLHLVRRLVPKECYSSLPTLPNLVSYSLRGCPIRLPNQNTKKQSTESSGPAQCRSHSQLHLNETVPRVGHHLIPDYLSPEISDQTDSHQNLSVRTCDSRIVVLGRKSSDLYRNLLNDTKLEEEMLSNLETDLPPCKDKQMKAVSAINIMSKLHKILEKPVEPASLCLKNVLQHSVPRSGGSKDVRRMSYVRWKTLKHKKIDQMHVKECEDAIKDTGVLRLTDTSKWNWEGIRIIFQVHNEPLKKLTVPTFKSFIVRVVQFYTPSWKQFSKLDLKQDNGKPNEITLTGCDLLDFLLDSECAECTKLLNELLEDLSNQIKSLLTSKSVHDCLFSPQHVTNSLCQDYFVFIGHLTATESGLVALQQTQLLQQLQQLVTTANLDCYVKLVISNLNYSTDGVTRKILQSALMCSYVSSRLYTTRFIHVLLRLRLRPELWKWFIQLLVNQLYDESSVISSAAVEALDEAVDNENYLEYVITLRPTLLHLGDRGLLLLVRFLSSKQGFTYLCTSNFIIPQLQKWAAGFNNRYVLLVEEALHDSMTHYQKGDDGMYRQRISGARLSVKDIFLPAHLYGQLARHPDGFNMLLKEDQFHHYIQVILNGLKETTEENMMELKSALWAVGSVAVSIHGLKYLSQNKVVSAIVKCAENFPVYSIKATAFHVLCLIATTRHGCNTLEKLGWRCLKRNRATQQQHPEHAHASYIADNSFEDSCNVDILIENGEILQEHSLENDAVVQFETHEGNVELSRKKSATLPQTLPPPLLVQHGRSLSESKADSSNDWPDSSDLKFTAESRSKQRSSSLCTDSSTSGISSSDSIGGKQFSTSEMIQTLTPIPSSSSISTMVATNRAGLPKRHGSVNFGCKLNAQSALGYKMLRMLQPNRYRMSSSLSASATMDMLTMQDRKQMSPLIRPKLSKYLHRPLQHEFEVKESHNPTKSDVVPEDAVDIEQIPDASASVCYQGVCLPLKLSRLFPAEVRVKRLAPFGSPRKSFSEKVIAKSVEHIADSSDTDIETSQSELVSDSFKKRRHNKSMCLLCSLKGTTNGDIGKSIKNRKSSTTSIQRTRTDTESSYGGGPTAETESPVLLTWQSKPVGLIDTSGGGNTSSATTTEIPSFVHQPSVDQETNLLKSRSLLRKEVLKLVEQLANPVLYKTCKQGLLHLKQMCGDLFQDVCLFSDVCGLLGSINYRIQARQLVQDLFLDAPFYELYEEPLAILDRVKETFVGKKQPDVTCTSPLKCANNLEIPVESRRSTNHELSVIIETDARSDTSFETESRTVSRHSSGRNDILVLNAFVDTSTVTSLVKEQTQLPEQHLIQSQENLMQSDIAPTFTVSSSTPSHSRESIFSVPASPLSSTSVPNLNFILCDIPVPSIVPGNCYHHCEHSDTQQQDDNDTQDNERSDAEGDNLYMTQHRVSSEDVTQNMEDTRSQSVVNSVILHQVDNNSDSDRHVTDGDHSHNDNVSNIVESSVSGTGDAPVNSENATSSTENNDNANSDMGSDLPSTSDSSSIQTSSGRRSSGRSGIPIRVTRRANKQRRRKLATAHPPDDNLLLGGATENSDRTE